MAENDCTVHQIAAKTGHRSLKEIQRYTDGANQPRLAAQAQAKVAAARKRAAEEASNVVPFAAPAERGT